jgi:arabinogalactan oligomer/maltooligosaccharide transport system substrate-binding protein
MRKLLTIAVLLFSVFAIVACQDDEPTEPTVVPTDPTVVPTDPTVPNNNGERIDFGDAFVQKSKIRVWIDDENGEYMEAVIAAFNDEYPNIVVEHQHMGTVDARELLKTFGPSGNGADVFQFPHDHLAAAIIEDLVLALPTATKTRLDAISHPLGLQIATLSYDESAKSFDPESPNSVERLYAVPMSIESIGLFYNKEFVTEVPTTFEALLAEVALFNAELAADGSGLTNAEKGIYGLATSSHWADSYFMQPIYSAFDFYPFGPELNNPNAVGFETAVDALDFMVNTLKPMVTGATGNHNSVTGGTNFENGLIPYIISGPWMHEAYKSAELNYGVAQFPTIGGEETRTFAGAQMAAVYKYSKNPEDAIKFVEFLSSDVAMQLQYDMKGKLPALNNDGLANITGLIDDELMLAMADQLVTSVPMPTIPQVQYYWGPGETMIIRVWNNAVAPATAAAEAEQSYRTQVGLSTT